MAELPRPERAAYDHRVAELPRGTVTFLFTDVERSTALTRRLGAAFGDVRAQHRRLLRTAFEANGGQEIETEGDAFFVVFDRAGDAVAAAVAAQRALAEAEWADDAELRVRIGIHTAEPHLHEDGYVGVGVSRANRICAAAHGGQILLSNATAGVAEDEEVTGIRVRDLGEYRLKDLERPQRLFQVDVDGLPSEFPPPNTGDAGDGGGIVTVLCADLIGWRRVLRMLGDAAAMAAAKRYHRLVLEAAAAQGGREFEVSGDLVIVVFDSVAAALVTAVEIREAVAAGDWIELANRPSVHLGAHSGRLVDPRARHGGTVVSRAVRLCHAAEAEQVLVSHASEALLEGEALGGVTLREAGERTLEGDDRPALVYELVGTTSSRGG